MEYIRRNSDYALRGLAYMARFPRGRKFTIDELTSSQDVPGDFLRKIFQKLAQYKIVGSSRGIGGGFYLLKPPSRISINKIIRAVQGPVTISNCIIDIDTCIRSSKCKIRKNLGDVQNRLEKLFEQTTLLDIA